MEKPSAYPLRGIKGGRRQVQCTAYASIAVSAAWHIFYDACERAETTTTGYRGAPGPRQMLAAKGRAAGRMGVQRGQREDPSRVRAGRFLPLPSSSTAYGMHQD